MEGGGGGLYDSDVCHRLFFFLSFFLFFFFSFFCVCVCVCVPFIHTLLS